PPAPYKAKSTSVRPSARTYSCTTRRSPAGRCCARIIACARICAVDYRSPPVHSRCFTTSRTCAASNIKPGSSTGTTHPRWSKPTTVCRSSGCTRARRSARLEARVARGEPRQRRDHPCFDACVVAMTRAVHVLELRGHAREFEIIGGFAGGIRALFTAAHEQNALSAAFTEGPRARYAPLGKAALDQDQAFHFFSVFDQHQRAHGRALREAGVVHAAIGNARRVASAQRRKRGKGLALERRVIRVVFAIRRIRPACTPAHTQQDRALAHDARPQLAMGFGRA